MKCSVGLRRKEIFTVPATNIDGCPQYSLFCTAECLQPLLAMFRNGIAECL